MISKTSPRWGCEHGTAVASGSDVAPSIFDTHHPTPRVGGGSSNGWVSGRLPGSDVLGRLGLPRWISEQTAAPPHRTTVRKIPTTVQMIFAVVLNGRRAGCDCTGP